MKVAIVHDWLTNYSGSESVVELMLRIYPDADLYTLVHDKKRMKGHFENNKIYTTYLQKIPFSTKIYQKLLKFMPKAFESFDFSDYDLVICSSTCCAKGVIVPPYVPQIAYVNSPMRYAWDLYFEYKKRSGKLTQFFMNRWMPQIRQWDYISSQRIDSIIANSNYIARRIKKFWNRDSVVIYPPLKTSKFFPLENHDREDFYVFFSRLVSYKRADLAINAAKKLNKKLVVIGGGNDYDEMVKLAEGNPNITFTGRAPDSVVLDYLQRCKALIFCAEEDFGIIPLEAQACGAPVIAFGRGGARETVIDGKTGIFFNKQDVDSVCEAINRFEEMDSKGVFVKEEMVKQGTSFTEEKFIASFTEVVNQAINKVKI